MSCKNKSKTCNQTLTEKLLCDDIGLCELGSALNLLITNNFRIGVKLKPNEIAFIKEILKIKPTPEESINYLLTHGVPDDFVFLIAASGLFDVREDSPLWLLKDKKGRTPAHWAARNGVLYFSYSSPLWELKDDEGNTPAHFWSRSQGITQDSEHVQIWRIKNKNGQTPAHWAADSGLLNISDNSDLWLLTDEKGNTPAHILAMKKKLKLPYHSPVWSMFNKKGDTPAHIMARFGMFYADSNSPLWLIKNPHGMTPAHIMATRADVHTSFVGKNGQLLNFFEIPHTSEIWYVSNIRGVTPAHLAAIRGLLKAPINSPVWFLLDRHNDAPVMYSKKGEITLSFIEDDDEFYHYYDLINYVEPRFFEEQEMSAEGLLSILRITAGQKVLYKKRIKNRLSQYLASVEQNNLRSFLSDHSDLLIQSVKNSLNSRVLNFVAGDRELNKLMIAALRVIFDAVSTDVKQSILSLQDRDTGQSIGDLLFQYGIFL